ncbi:MAG: DUF3822 family protein [Bacteroidales bacterium]|jgi:hypothetical protein
MPATGNKLKYTLIPTSLFKEEQQYKLLSELVQLDENDTVKHIALPDYEAVLVYAVSSSFGYIPVVYDLLTTLNKIHEHNKILVSFRDGYVHIVMAEGNKLLLCNSFPASDITTAEYFIFYAIKEFQINPEMTTIYFFEEIVDEIRDELFKYFQGVESISVFENKI